MPADMHDHAAVVSLAYAAVTARMHDDAPEVVRCVREFIAEPGFAAAGMLALLHACQALVDIAATATGLSCEEMWSRYATHVAWAAINLPLSDGQS